MIPVLHLVINNIEGVALVLCDIVWKEITPGIMWVVFNIDVGSSGDFRGGAERTNVMRFATVIPSDNPAVC